MSCHCNVSSPGRWSRRGFFHSMASGVYGAALASLFSRDLYPGSALLAGERAEHDAGARGGVRASHFEPRAKAVIQLFMNGGPSQMDLFDPKPELDRQHGEPFFEKIAGEVENPGSAGALMRSSFKFARHGQCGAWVSDVMPHLAGVVDSLAFIRSMHTSNLTHEPALWQIHSGQTLPGLPSLGSWIVYGLGSECADLPAYVVLDDPGGLPVNGVQNWQAGYLPPACQGTRFRSTGSPLLDLRPPVDEPPEIMHLERELLAALDRIHGQSRPYQPQLEARIASYELAGRMQLSASDALDLAGETAETLEMYGIGQTQTDSYGRRCLFARRLVERGVRFVQLFIESQIWDHHSELATGLKSACEKTDKPIAGLVADLRRRGLLDQTLVVWGGEFGRLPIAQLPQDKDPAKAGRDHNKNAFCTWMAGGGVKGGVTWGATDELGLRAVADPVSVADWHATILRLLGLHHEELYYERNGLHEKLTGTAEARVVEEILA